MARLKSKLLSRIEFNPKKMAGKPVIRGTRIPVERVVRMVARGWSFDKIRCEYPYLTQPDVDAALWYAAQVLSVSEFVPI